MPPLVPTPDGFLRHGEPHLVVSGAIHYFRVHPELWRDRLRRLVAMGCNTVETYVAWNFHAPTLDTVTFEGMADLGRFLDIAAEEGLDAIVRPGPYICAEWEFGGFPGWLQADGKLPLRCMNPTYLAAVDQWFDQLLPVIADRQTTRGGNVVAVQVENEYGSYGDDRAYLEHLRDGLIRRGIDELLVTSDGPGWGWLSGGMVDGALATVNFGSRTLEVLDMARKELPDQPQMCMEFWNGWFDHWGEEHHTRSAESAASELKDMLDNGMSVNFYMAHGGTNFGLWAGANNDGRLQPTVTSYDYDSPIAENGTLTPKFHAFREVIAAHRGLPPLEEQLRELGLDAVPASLPGQGLPWDTLASLQDLPTWTQPGATHPRIPTFEEIGLERGMLLTRRSITITRPPEGEELWPIRFHGLADRAYVYLNGHYAGISDRNAEDVAVHPEHLREVLLPEGADRAEVTLEILIENQGRTNFGPELGELKGVLGGVWFGYRYLNGWQVTPLPLEQLGVQFADEAEAAHGSDNRLPLVGVATLEVSEQADGFLDTSGCGRGIAWLDDFCLGRYWSAGPQRTLYIPSPLLTPGAHRITVLELESDNPTISISKEPLL